MEMDICCYIIYSKQIDRFYIGVTQSSLIGRIDFHNSAKYGKNKFTAKANDWELFLKIDVINIQHALKIERKIKSMKSRIYIQNLSKYPELITKIKSETQPN